MDTQNSNSILKDLNIDIERRSLILAIFGGVLFIACVFAAYYLYADIKRVLDEQIKSINLPKSDARATLVTVYLVFRVLTLGTIPTALLIFGYNIVRASLDQSIRFAKRKHAAMFWEFMHNNYHDQIKDIKFDSFKDAFESWNKTTESSFTSFRVGDKNHFGNALENLSNQLKELKERIERKEPIKPES